MLPGDRTGELLDESGKVSKRVHSRCSCGAASAERRWRRRRRTCSAGSRAGRWYAAAGLEIRKERARLGEFHLEFVDLVLLRAQRLPVARDLPGARDWGGRCDGDRRRRPGRASAVEASGVEAT